MNEDGQRILRYLEAVVSERATRAASSELGARVLAIKAFQHARFARTYKDLMADPAHSAAALFFLEELYGPHDFTDRDAQFARTVPALVRLFSSEVVRTVQTLAELHAISERLDTAMGNATSGVEIDASAYCAAWCTVGQRRDRERQIDAMLEVGRALVRFTANPLLYQALRLMRGPAKLAGLNALQHFLERGFETFRRMSRQHIFLETVSYRERAIAKALFAGDTSSIT